MTLTNIAKEFNERFLYFLRTLYYLDYFAKNCRSIINLIINLIDDDYNVLDAEDIDVIKDLLSVLLLRILDDINFFEVKED